MPSLSIPASGLSLSSGQSSAQYGVPSTDIFTLTLADSVIEDMIKCVRNGKPVQLSLGKSPKIIYGSQTQNLATISDTFPCEYFRTTISPRSSSSIATATSQSHIIDNMSYLWGSSNRKLVPQNIRTVKNGVTISQTVAPPRKAIAKKDSPKSPTPDTSPTEGVDAALAALRSSLASEDARKKDNITKHVKDTSTLPPAVQQRGPAKPMKDGNKARFLSQSNTKPLPGNAARSMPTSPALTGINSPSLGPTSVPLSQQQAERTKAICRPIIHKLALGPAAEGEIIKYKKNDANEQEFRLALDKVADLVDGKWKLKQRAFRDLDVFTYNRYTQEERQVAIDNAIAVYDRIRLATSDPEWERLLPFEERGAGKCLSKLQLKIAVGAIKPAKAPRIKVHGAEDSGRDTPAADDDLDDLFGEKIPTIALKSENMVRSHSNPPAAKQKRTSEKEQQAKRLLTKGRVTKPTAIKSSDKKSATKESNKIKSSEFVRESDEEDDYLIPAPKATPAPTIASKINGTKAPASKVKQGMKSSSREEVGEMSPKFNGNQKPKVNNTSPPKSSPLASSPPTNASDFDDSSSSSSNSLKRKATDSSSDIPLSKRHQKSSSNSTSSSVASSNSVVNGERLDPFYYEVMRKEVSATKKFVIYYKKYAELYRELAASQDKDRDVEKMADLMAMHERLAQMKADILPAGET